MDGAEDRPSSEAERHSRGRIPLATYRLQFDAAFGFRRAAELAPYLAQLGVSHVYCSPYLRPRPGSAHGYDIINHNELNPELGGAEAYADMVAAFEENGLRQVVDFVPNHMGVGGADNPWWLDVLQWGRRSEYADWFDIDWEPDQLYLHDKLLAPFLGDQYGAALSSGALKLKFDPDVGAFAVWAYDHHKFPVCPLHYGLILGEDHPILARLGDAFANLSLRDRHVARRAEALQRALAEAVASPDAAAAVGRSLAKFEGQAGVLEGWERLDALINRQAWRLAYFRVADDDINYRRFFAVNELARIRMELPELFDRTHTLLFRLIEEEIVDGLRIDHVDGLLDPRGYCLRLREKAPRPIYLVVEKILAHHEELRDDWDIDGATGYETASLITGLLIDPRGEGPLTRFYLEFAGRSETVEEAIRACKIRIMENELASELNALAREIAALARSNPRTADFTKNVLQRALKEIIAVFPIYRTYVDDRGAPSAADRRAIDWAVAKARRYDLPIDPSVFDFLHALLTCDLVAEARSGFSRAAVIRAAMRVQQYSGPVMAKGMEDTAFYRTVRLVALNEVGGAPGRFGVTRSAFHRANRKRAKRFPHAMLSLSTHDSKRGEDARARLAVLSECPDEWAENVIAWSRILRAGASGSWPESPPDRNDEYLFYQQLLGCWPAELSADAADPEALGAFRERIGGAMTKAIREAKVHTTWTLPNAAYEKAVLDFVGAALDVSRKNHFLEAFAPFFRKIAAAGVRNSLVQTVLKLTLPGVPDIYQGAELWDLNFVDPDNRRPVDYETRRRLLEALQTDSEAPSEAFLRDLLANWTDGRIKLFVTARLLTLRRSQANLLQNGGYEALRTYGADADQTCAFARRRQEKAVIVAVRRRQLRSEAPAQARIALPAVLSRREWRDVLTGARIEATEDSISANELFNVLPAAVLCAL